MSFESEVIQLCYDTLTGDPTLLSLMPVDPEDSVQEVKVFLEMAEPDETYPYLIQKIKLEGAPNEIWTQREGMWTCSVQDRANEAARGIAIREGVRALLENGCLRSVNGAVKGLRFRYEGGVMVPEREDIWRCDLFFYIRGFDQAAVAAAASRPQRP